MFYSSWFYGDIISLSTPLYKNHKSFFLAALDDGLFKIVHGRNGLIIYLSNNIADIDADTGQV